MSRHRARRLAPVLVLAGLAAAAPAYAYVATTVTGTAVLRTATLGKPGAAAETEGSDVFIRVLPPDAGPLPARYTVVRLPEDDGGEDDRHGDADGGQVVCDRTTQSRCPDPSAPPAAELRYVVTAYLGDHWIARSTPLAVMTPPPQPTLAPTAGAGGLTVSAAAGVLGYRVDVFLDGASEPFRTLSATPGKRLDVEVRWPALPPGPHVVRAVSSLDGMQVTSEPLQLTTGEATAQPTDSAPSPTSNEASSVPSATVSPEERTEPATGVPSGTTASTDVAQTAAGPAFTIATAAGTPSIGTDPPPSDDN